MKYIEIKSEGYTYRYDFEYTNKLAKVQLSPLASNYKRSCPGFVVSQPLT